MTPEAHTPGPWKPMNGCTSMIFTESDPYGHGQMHVADLRGWGHLTGRGGGCAFDEDKAVSIQEANARLISAAPDLLAACKFALSVLTAGGLFELSERLAHEKLSVAIAKSEGAL